MKQQMWNEQNFPAIVEAGRETSLPEHLSRNRDALDESLHQTGAILFRGFAVPETEDFDVAVQSYGAENFPYKESLSNAVRMYRLYICWACVHCCTTFCSRRRCDPTWDHSSIMVLEHWCVTRCLPLMTFLAAMC